MTIKKVRLLAIISTIIILSLILLSRKKNYHGTDIAGGPCSYEEETYPIIIKNIIPFGTTSFDLELYNFSYKNYDKIVYFHQENNSYLDSSQISSLHIGDTITLIESTIVSGSCSPHLFSIDTKKFSNKEK